MSRKLKGIPKKGRPKKRKIDNTPKLNYTEEGMVRLGKGQVDPSELVDLADPTLNGKLKMMVQKQKRITGSRQKVMTIKGVLGKQMFSAITIDRKRNKEGILFEETLGERCLNVPLAEDWIHEGWAYEEVDLKGAAGQLVATRVKFKYPTINIDTPGIYNITRFFKNNVIINYGVAKSIIDDETFNIIKEFLRTFDVYINQKKLTIGLVPRFGLGGVNSVTLEELLKAEIGQGYINHKIGDKVREFSYTHILRRNLGLTLQLWQRTLITNWKQYNFIAGSRRIGKSYLSSYIAYREFYRKGSGYGDRNRQVLYVTLNDKKAWQPFQYMMQMTERDRDLGYVTVNQGTKEFTCLLTGTKLIFITAGQRGGAASYGADLVIIDEAAMIPNEFWDDLLPIIVQERASVFAISTINEGAKQNWFYRYLLKGEMGDPNIQSIRVTIDDNELLRKEDKESMKESLIENQMKYWTQLYSIFPTGSSIFKMNGVIKSINTDGKRDMVVIGYDPAKLGDNAAFVVFDPQTFEVIHEHIMKGVPYFEQKTFLIELKKQYYNSVVIMDRSGVGEGVFEIFGELIDASVRYKSSGDVIFTERGYWTVSKTELIETLRLYIDIYNLKISDTLDNIIKEFKHFKVLKDRGRVVQYGGVGFTDDSVNALALVTFYMKHISGITSQLDFNTNNNTIELDQYGNVLDPNNPTTNSFESYDFEDTYGNFIY